jgi:hypothetical protein
MNTINEIKRCASDVTYFANKYVKIMDCRLGITQIVLNEEQLQVIDEFKSSDIFLKGMKRQSGKTTVAAIILLNQSIFNLDSISAVVFDFSSLMLTTISLMYENLPDFLRFDKDILRNISSIKFVNGSSIYAANSKSSLELSLRGKARSKISTLYIDESDYIEDLDILIRDVRSILLPSKLKVFSLTTFKTADMFERLNVSLKDNTYFI